MELDGDIEFKRNALKGTWYLYVTIEKETYKIDGRQFEIFQQYNDKPIKYSRLCHGKFHDGEKFYNKYMKRR